MKTKTTILAAVAIAALFAFVPLAEAKQKTAAQYAAEADAANPYKPETDVRKMSSGDRKAMWYSLTDEQKKAILEKRKAQQDKKDRWTKLTPSEQKRKKADDALEQSLSGTLSTEQREALQAKSPGDAALNNTRALAQWTQLSPDQKYLILKDTKAKWETLTTEEKLQMKAILNYEKAHKGDYIGILPGGVGNNGQGDASIAVGEPYPAGGFRPTGSVSRPEGTTIERGIYESHELNNRENSAGLTNGTTSSRGYSYSQFGANRSSQGNDR